MFSSFDGSWTARYHSRSKVLDPILNKYIYKYKAILSYSVFVRPRGPVPVLALEWRIREDIPINLKAVKQAAEKYFKIGQSSKKDEVKDDDQFFAINQQQPEWANDETLASYIKKIRIKDKKDIKKINLY
jgi:hypothetical protein